MQPSNGREWLLKPPLLELDLQGSRQSMNVSFGQLVCVSPKLMWLTQNWNVLSTWTSFLWRKTQMVQCTLLLVLWQGEQLLRCVKHFCQSLHNYCGQYSWYLIIYWPQYVLVITEIISLYTSPLTPKIAAYIGLAFRWMSVNLVWLLLLEKLFGVRDLLT